MTNSLTCRSFGQRYSDSSIWRLEDFAGGEVLLIRCGRFLGRQVSAMDVGAVDPCAKSETLSVQAITLIGLDIAKLFRSGIRPHKCSNWVRGGKLCLLRCDCRNGVHLACNIAIMLSQPLIVEASLLIVYLYSFVQWIFISLQSQYMFAADVGLVADLRHNWPAAGVFS